MQIKSACQELSNKPPHGQRFGPSLVPILWPMNFKGHLDGVDEVAGVVSDEDDEECPVLVEVSPAGMRTNNALLFNKK